MRESELIKKVFEQYAFSKGLFKTHSAFLRNNHLEVTEHDDLEKLKEIIWGKARKLVEEGMEHIAFERGLFQ